MYDSVAALLHAHGINAPETPWTASEYTGAALARIDDGGRRFVLKRIRYDTDWLMQRTLDVHCREAQFAASPLASALPPGVATPLLGAARDGDGWAVLMHDIGGAMFPDDGSLLPVETVDLILARLAALHASFWQRDDAGADIDLAPLRERFLALSPETGARLLAAGRDFGLARGWRVFDEVAPPGAVRIARMLFAAPAPLVAACDALPRTLIHGDAKVANVGVEGGALLLIDWALVARAPVAIELGWFLAVNSSRLPESLDVTLERYRRHLAQALGARDPRWDAQLDVLALSGLLAYGWGKALDAQSGRPEELQWWCTRAAAAARRLGV